MVNSRHLTYRSVHSIPRSESDRNKRRRKTVEAKGTTTGHWSVLIREEKLSAKTIDADQWGSNGPHHTCWTRVIIVQLSITISNNMAKTVLSIPWGPTPDLRFYGNFWICDDILPYTVLIKDAPSCHQSFAPSGNFMIHFKFDYFLAWAGMCHFSFLWSPVYNGRERHISKTQNSYNTPM